MCMRYILFENFLPMEAKDIRYKVFTLEQGFDKDVDLDKFDKKSVHILVYENDEPVATARLFREIGYTFHIGRLAVLKEYRKKGVGSYTLKILEDEAKKRGAERIVLGSQIDKSEFYEKNGYMRFGDVFDDAGYPHIMMEKKI